MVFEEIRPNKLLQNAIQCFWYYRDDGLNTVERVIPDGCLEVVFHLGKRVERQTAKTSQLNPRSNIIGQMTKPYLIKTKGHVNMVGVRFWPHGASPFFDFALGELQDEVLSVETIWKKEGAELEERVMTCTDYLEAIQCIQSFLINKLQQNYLRAKNKLTQHGVRKILSHNGIMKIDALAKELNISRRYLEMLFKDYVGLSPKHFSRIVQFQHVFSLVKSNQGFSLTQLAYAGEYADQSHFIRTCRQLTGVSPKALFREASPIHQNFRSEDSISHLFNFQD